MMFMLLISDVVDMVVGEGMAGMTTGLGNDRAERTAAWNVFCVFSLHNASVMVGLLITIIRVIVRDTL